MPAFRLVGRLDIKGPNVIKGIHLEGLRVVGEPGALAQAYYQQGIDELLYMDAVASLYKRNSLLDLVSTTAQEVFVPLTVGGGIRTCEDVHAMLRAGADKVAINTAAIDRPELITEVARRFGSQCMVLSVEAKRAVDGNSWEARVDGGRQRTGHDVLEWIAEAVARGAGEILVTSVDHEGTRRGFDEALVRAVSERVDVPVIASGGFGNTDHLVSLAHTTAASGAAVAGGLHYEHTTVGALRDALSQAAVAVRRP